jgi:hypothetical protein
MNRGGGRAGRESALALLLFCLGPAGVGCAREMSHQAVETAMRDVMAEQDRAKADESFAYVATQRAVAGAIATLEAPEQRERLRRIVSDVVSDAVQTALRTALTAKEPGPDGVGERGLAEVLVTQLAETATGEVSRQLSSQLSSALAPDGELTSGVVSAGERASAAAVAGALAEIFPSCAGVTGAANVAACRRRALNETARETASSVAAGFREQLALPVVIAVAIIALGLGILFHWLWTRRWRRNRTFQEA